jgi:hypothetical protein
MTLLQAEGSFGAAIAGHDLRHGARRRRAAGEDAAGAELPLVHGQVASALSLGAIDRSPVRVVRLFSRQPGI